MLLDERIDNSVRRLDQFEVARRILDPRYPKPKTRAWLRTKRLHDAVGRLWLRRPPRELSLRALSALCRRPAARRRVSAFFLDG